MAMVRSAKLVVQTSELGGRLDPPSKIPAWTSMRAPEPKAKVATVVAQTLLAEPVLRKMPLPVKTVSAVLLMLLMALISRTAPEEISTAPLLVVPRKTRVPCWTEVLPV